MRALCIAALSFTLAGAASAKGFYIAPYGGANFTNGFSGYGTDGFAVIDVHANEDTGYVIGGVLGAPIDALPGLSIEGDLSFRRNDITGTWTLTYPDVPPEGPLPALDAAADAILFDNPFEGHDSTFAFMANAVYRLEGVVEPYVFAGAGYAQRTLVLTSGGFGPELDTSEGGFAWQLGAGVDVRLAKGVKAGIGYRYFQAPSIQRDTLLGPTPLSFDADGQNQSATVALTFQFD